MTKTCDNKSVGVIIRDQGRMLIIKRKNYPVALACVAGHLDGDTPLAAAIKETGEEVGLSFSSERFRERLAHLKLTNPCKRDGGDGHEWFVYEVNAPEVTPQAGSDAKEAMWVDALELSQLVKRTEQIAKKHGIRVEDLARSTPAVVNDPEWNENPGFEPVWVVLLKALHIV